MAAKKNAINISIVMILLSLVVILICWCWKDNGGIAELFHVLSSGVFGSSFATLWIFIYEYNKEKRYLLSSIFNEAVAIFEFTPLYHLEMFGFYEPGIREYLERKYYMPPVDADTVKHMSKQENCLYILCRFVDEVLDIGYGRIDHICEMVSDVDFWSDSFRRKLKYKSVISRKISFPLYDVFISAPAMEDGYLFRYFKDFKVNYSYSADQIYEIAGNLDKALHGSGEVKYSWNNKGLNLASHMHEALWIFRDAFFSPHLSNRERREAMRAFLKDTPYYRIR